MKQITKLNIPIKSFAKIIDNKYKIEIIYLLSIKKMRFGKLKTELNTITQQLLTKHLRQMEKDHLLRRKIYEGFPRKVDYSLTSFGKSFKPVIDSIVKWEKNNIRKIRKLFLKNNKKSLYDYY